VTDDEACQFELVLKLELESWCARARNLSPPSLSISFVALLCCGLVSLARSLAVTRKTHSLARPHLLVERRSERTTTRGSSGSEREL